jgi:hypothetical protein
MTLPYVRLAERTIDNDSRLALVSDVILFRLTDALTVFF